MNRTKSFIIAGALCLLLLFVIYAIVIVSRPVPLEIQGEVEATQVRVASKLVGRIDSLAVKKGDEKATFYHEAMAYQIAKYIGEMSTVLKGKVDGILITGGIAFDRRMMSLIRERVEFIAPVSVYAGQDELKALAMNALMVARGEVEPRIYDIRE